MRVIIAKSADATVDERLKRRLITRVQLGIRADLVKNAVVEGDDPLEGIDGLGRKGGHGRKREAAGAAENQSTSLHDYFSLSLSVSAGLPASSSASSSSKLKGVRLLSWASSSI